MADVLHCTETTHPSTYSHKIYSTSGTLDLFSSNAAAHPWRDDQMTRACVEGCRHKPDIAKETPCSTLSWTKAKRNKRRKRKNHPYHSQP
jgi:hypothetical protein